MKILLVDDSPTMLMSLTTILDREGHTYETADSGEDALAVLDRGFAPELVVTDLNMPGMNGIELVAALRARPGFAFVPILMLTTESKQEMRKQARAAGATGWLVKPVDPEALLKVLQQVVARA